MEGVELKQFADIYRGRRVLVTGHTGFKGSWLSLWLTKLGAQVTGLSLPPPTSPNHWDLLSLDIAEHQVDIRDAVATAKAVRQVQPEVLFHLAAQSLVRRSYKDPLETWSTNVMGTANVLEACRRVTGLRAIVVVTSDKCYENRDQLASYNESDKLGGRDPYSASKAAAELVAHSFRKSFFYEELPLIATARAGNVIGGGDWSEDRLIPDVARAAAAGSSLEIRSPDATRPWQHVLESVSGYLLLGQKLLEGLRSYEGAWNFGPALGDNCTVSELLKQMAQFWPGLTWELARSPQLHEAKFLALDSKKARQQLGWRPVWPLETALRVTAEWYWGYLNDGKPQSRAQLHRYVENAQQAEVAWIL